jgi:uncharacterized glyoxalase superfamily protein PhnB
MADEKRPAIPGVIAYFTVSDTKAATAFYEKAFGATLKDRRELPDGRSMHVHVEINGGAMAAALPGAPRQLAFGVDPHCRSR